MKMTISFVDHDDYDALVGDLVDMAIELLDHHEDDDARTLLKIVKMLLDGEIVEP